MVIVADKEQRETNIRLSFSSAIRWQPCFLYLC